MYVKKNKEFLIIIYLIGLKNMLYLCILSKCLYVKIFYLLFILIINFNLFLIV